MEEAASFGILAIFVVIGILLRHAWVKAKVERKRKKAIRLNDTLNQLAQRFGGENAACLMQGRLAQGMTPEMLHFLLGEPVSVDEKATKSKVTHTYKYQSTGIGRYALRIQLENDKVVGWDIKGAFIPNPSYGFEFRQCSDGLWRFVPPEIEEV